MNSIPSDSASSVSPRRDDDRRFLGELLLGDTRDEQRLVATISSCFSNITATNFEKVVRWCLRLVGEQFNADICDLCQFNAKGWTIIAWTASGIPAREEEDVTPEQYPWHWRQLRDGRPIIINSLEDYPSEAVVDRATSLVRGERAWISLPVCHGSEVIASLSILSHRGPRVWSRSEICTMNSIVNIIANGLVRLKSEETLRAQAVEQERLREALYRSSRISTMGEMTAAIAHEINQPLTGILTNAQTALRVLARKNPPLNEIKEIARDILSDADRAREVIVKLRSLLQKSRIQKVMLCINETLSEVLPVVHSLLVIRHITFSTRLASNLPSVRGDRIQLQQVVLNLLFNAIDAMRDSGRRTLRLSTERAGDFIVVRMTDSGRGIDESALAQLFDPFFTTKHDGLGMGLAINKAIITAHGGTIEARNNPDGGATFSFSLPIADAAQVRRN